MANIVVTGSVKEAVANAKDGDRLIVKPGATMDYPKVNAAYDKVVQTTFRLYIVYPGGDGC